MENIIREELLKKLGSGKLHKVDTLRIEIDEIGTGYVKISVWADIPKLGRFRVGDPRLDFCLNEKSTLTIKTNKNFKVKQRIEIS